MRTLARSSCLGAPLGQSGSRWKVVPNRTRRCLTRCAHPVWTKPRGQGGRPTATHHHGYRHCTPQAAHGHCRARIDMAVTSVVVDDNDVEWQPCHCGRGSGREQPGECSGDSRIAMMVGGRWAPPLATWLGPDWMRAPGWAPSCSVGCCISLARRTPCLR